ncbi:unnamed protein product [Larinioides sclopetarius]|uniref:Uncharacterized protein n=1 Tax=Larinioides sclopetarius TaxID=280406 RepID=A0AAV2BGP5_9ARAC
MWKLERSTDSQDHHFGTEGLKASTLAARVQNHLYVRSRYTNLTLLLACRTFCKDQSTWDAEDESWFLLRIRKDQATWDAGDES